MQPALVATPAIRNDNYGIEAAHYSDCLDVSELLENTVRTPTEHLVMAVKKPSGTLLMCL